MEIRIDDHIPNFLLCDYKKSTKGPVRFQNHLKIAEECLNIPFSESLERMLMKRFTNEFLLHSDYGGHSGASYGMGLAYGRRGFCIQTFEAKKSHRLWN